jgi:hypothetical protein
MSDASVDRLTPQQIDQLADISGTILEAVEHGDSLGNAGALTVGDV